MGFAEPFRVHLRAFPVMVNHVHLQQTDDAYLSRFMQSFLTSFAMRHNLRHGSGGHVFQGRFKVFVVEEDSAYRDPDIAATVRKVRCELATNVKV